MFDKKVFLNEVVQLLDFKESLTHIIYPAPAPLQGLAHDLSELTLDEIQERLSPDELWQAGNAFLKGGHFEKAYKYYQMFQERQGFDAKIESLLGLSALLDDKIEKSNSHLSKALLKNADMELSRVWLAYARFFQSKTRSVRIQAKRVLESTDKKHLKLLCYTLLALDSATRGDVKLLEQYVDEGIRVEDTHILKVLRTALGFLNGAQLFETGDEESAFLAWHKCYQESEDSWRFIPRIKIFFDRQSFVFSKKNNSSENEHYDTTAMLIELKLFPEFFEPKESLQERLNYWGQQIDPKRPYPYALYRLAICQIYLSFYEDAIENLEMSRDKTPPSKLNHFQFQELLHRVRSKLDDGYVEVTQRGEVKNLEDKIWNSDQLDLSDEQVQLWKGFKVPLEQARPWIQAGFKEPRAMLRWERLGVTASQARAWKDIFGENLSLAISFYAAGFTDPKTAHEWSEFFSVPSEAFLCYSQGKKPSDTV